MAVYAGLPRFQSVFKLAKQEEFLDPDFVRFFEPLLEGKPVHDLTLLSSVVFNCVSLCATGG